MKYVAKIFQRNLIYCIIFLILSKLRRMLLRLDSVWSVYYWTILFYFIFYFLIACWNLLSKRFFKVAFSKVYLLHRDHSATCNIIPTMLKMVSGRSSRARMRLSVIKFYITCQPPCKVQRQLFAQASSLTAELYCQWNSRISPTRDFPCRFSFHLPLSKCSPR